MAETTTSDRVDFQLVSPERLLRSEPVEMVVVPGAEGDFGVLAGHTPFISAVRPGVIDIHEKGRVRERIFVAGGFAEVSPERCTVLAEEAMPVAEIEAGAAERRLNEARQALADAQQSEDADRAAAEAELTTAEAMMAAIRS